MKRFQCYKDMWKGKSRLIRNVIMMNFFEMRFIRSTDMPVTRKESEFVVYIRPE